MFSQHVNSNTISNMLPVEEFNNIIPDFEELASLAITYMDCNTGFRTSEGIAYLENDKGNLRKQIDKGVEMLKHDDLYKACQAGEIKSKKSEIKDIDSLDLFIEETIPNGDSYCSLTVNYSGGDQKLRELNNKNKRELHRLIMDFFLNKEESQIFKYVKKNALIVDGVAENNKMVELSENVFKNLSKYKTKPVEKGRVTTILPNGKIHTVDGTEVVFDQKILDKYSGKYHPLKLLFGEDSNEISMRADSTGACGTLLSYQTNVKGPHLKNLYLIGGIGLNILNDAGIFINDTVKGFLSCKLSIAKFKMDTRKYYALSAENKQNFFDLNRPESLINNYESIDTKKAHDFYSRKKLEIINDQVELEEIDDYQADLEDKVIEEVIEEEIEAK